LIDSSSQRIATVEFIVEGKGKFPLLLVSLPVEEGTQAVGAGDVDTVVG